LRNDALAYLTSIHGSKADGTYLVGFGRPKPRCCDLDSAKPKPQWSDTSRHGCHRAWYGGGL